MRSKKITNQTRFGFFYRLMLTVNGLIFILLVIFLLLAQFSASAIPYGTENVPALVFGLLFIPIMIFILIPLSVLNLIYFSSLLSHKSSSKNQKIVSIRMFSNKNLTKTQKTVSIGVLVISAITLCFCLINVGVIPISQQ